VLLLYFAKQHTLIDYTLIPTWWSLQCGSSRPQDRVSPFHCQCLQLVRGGQATSYPDLNVVKQDFLSSIDIDMTIRTTHKSWFLFSYYRVLRYSQTLALPAPSPIRCPNVRTMTSFTRSTSGVSTSITRLGFSNNPLNSSGNTSRSKLN